MHIDRSDIEIIVNTIIDERPKDIADSMERAAYYERDHSGALESALARVFDTIREAINSNIEENTP